MHHGQLTPEHENREKKIRQDEKEEVRLENIILTYSINNWYHYSALSGQTQPHNCSVCITRENEKQCEALKRDIKRDLLSKVSTFLVGADNLDHLIVLALCIYHIFMILTTAV